MNFANLLTSFQNLVQWVRDGLSKKQSSAIVGTADPTNDVGNDGDIFLVVDP